MLIKLKKRLTFIFSLLTSLIVMTAIAVICLYNIRRMNYDSLEDFNREKYFIEQHLRTNSIIRDSWLSQVEIENRMILYIEEDGVPFFFRGAWLDNENRSRLLARIKALAADHGFPQEAFVESALSSDIVESPVFTIYRRRSEKFFGCMVQIPSENNTKTLTILKYLPEHAVQIKNMLLLFCAALFFSVIALILVSHYIVKKALKPVDRNQKRQKEFIASASHELRSPLAVIRASASALAAGPDELPRFVPRIEEECERMSVLINDMLSLASSDAHNLKVDIEPLEADTLLIDLYEAYFPLAMQRKRSLLLTLPDEMLPRIAADRLRFRQILSILLDNALCYAPEHSEILLSAGPRKKGRRPYVCFEVVDHGKGLADKEKLRVFDRFYRGDHSRSDKNHFGLGLSVARELTLLHNGYITIEDTPGGGCTFQVWIPALRR